MPIKDIWNKERRGGNEMIRILEQIETNPYYNPKKSSNGGGYSHPEITFEFNGIVGTFHDTSCGDFGTRFTVQWDGKKFELDEIQRGTHPEKSFRYVSTFSEEDKPFIKEFEKLFGKKIMTASEVDEWDNFVWEKYAQEGGIL